MADERRVGALATLVNAKDTEKRVGALATLVNAKDTEKRVGALCLLVHSIGVESTGSPWLHYAQMRRGL